MYLLGFVKKSARRSGSWRASVPLFLAINLLAIAFVKWRDICEYIKLNEDKLIILAKACINIEIICAILIALLVVYNRTKISKRFFGIKLTYRVLIGLFMGVIVGIVLRYNPNCFAIFGITSQSFKILGKVFIDLIKMVISPLIFASITCSVIGSGESKTGKLAVKSVFAFLLMTLVSVGIGIGVTTAFKPGKMIKTDPAKIIESNIGDVNKITSSEHAKLNTFGDFILDIVPDNIFKSFMTSNFLQIIFFSVIFGTAIRISGGSKSSVARAMESLNAIMFKITDMIMQIAPFGIFGFTTWVFGSQDASLIQSLGAIVLIVYGSILFMVYVIYSAVMSFVLKLNPLKFHKKMFTNQLTGYLLASSSAVLPNSLKIAQEKLGVSKEKALFIIPLGATVNMNGTALNLGVSVIFIAQIFGFDMDFSQVIYVMILCTLGAVGTAPIPGASIFLLSGILSTLHLPVEAIGIILAVDRILDMARTFGNITGDVLSSVIIDRLDGTLDEGTWNSKKS